MVIMFYEMFEYVCLMFLDLVDDYDDLLVQMNQFFIVDYGYGVLIDLGGQMIYNVLFLVMNWYFLFKQFDYVLVLYVDFDIVVLVGWWLISLSCDILIFCVWECFLLYFCSVGKIEGCIVLILDMGMVILLG